MKIIIANSDIGALIKASEAVFSKYQDRDNIPENIKGQTVLSVLKNITQRKDYFSICEIDALAKMNEVIISPEHYEFLRTLHCIHWADMHQDTREYVFALLVDYFRGNLVMANSNYGTL